MHLQYKNTKQNIQAVQKRARHVAPHLHNTLELVYVTEGTLELGVGQELYHLETGDMGIIFPDIIHHYQVFGADAHKIYLVNMMYVDKMECYKVHMENGIELPIPREKYRKVRESYFKVMGEM